MNHAARLERFASISATLALLSNQELTRMADAAEPLGSGIGGSTLTLTIDGQELFAKRVRLTDLERRPEHLLSTANLFGLPPHYQRNVGSAGFGVWRELAAHALANSWVLSQQVDCFPLMLHWRVLDGAASPHAKPPPPEWTDVKRMSAYWGNSAAVEQRLTALAGASASVLIVMERLPWTLSVWLNEQLDAGPEALAAACKMVEDCLNTDIPKINALGLLHGDAHHGNMLTDGQRLYYADLGLASSTRFALGADERQYLHDNASLDLAYVRGKWVNWLLKAWLPGLAEAPARMALVKRIARGEAALQLLPGLPPSLALSMERYAPIAALINDFYIGLHEHSRSSPYPRAAVEALLATPGN
ncbi:protein kinase family protein [Roseateles oligotrophus]|uniref:Serine/threonine protein phosphatase n=1 Tax=Roseateles oligotrophus TaxID=1769250 RepID=A0ABT2YA47_9BURK|nr:hypothetical protein [Roseateles oligotrophus]MCV2367181.1 hypothetical protein [Roseateles oligotrophus]